MAINYSVEYPKLQQRFYQLEAEIERLKRDLRQSAEWLAESGASNQKMMAKNKRLREALSCLTAEARGVCWMTGAQEFMGNTNQQCLQRRIEQAETALKGKS